MTHEEFKSITKSLNWDILKTSQMLGLGYGQTKKINSGHAPVTDRTAEQLKQYKELHNIRDTLNNILN